MAAPLSIMAGSICTMQCLFYVFLALFLSARAAKLNAPKVLLPYYSSVITNFTLEVEFSPEESQTQVANCYRW